MQHLGDITKIDGAKVSSVDVITGGSPCQDLSIAGRRAGLAGQRSGLFMEQIRIVKEMRSATANDDIRLVRPRYMVWENVQGAFSSNGGRDFQAVLTEIAKISDPGCPDVPLPEKGRWSKSGCLLGDGFSIAWRLHDAQFWGVPQRRKRISLVADFAGHSAPEVLFERKGLCRDSEEVRDQAQGAAADAEGSVGETSPICMNGCGGRNTTITEDTSGTVMEMHPPIVAQMYENHGKEARYTGPLKTAPTVVAQYGTGGNNTPLVLQVPYGISSYKSNAMMSDNPHSGIYEAETSRTLDLNGGYPGCNQGGIAVVGKCYAIQGNMIGRRDENGPQGAGIKEDVAFTLNTADKQAVCYHASKGSFMTKFDNGDAADTLVATDYKDPPCVAVAPHYIVRRLTPLECERLQGYPDGWTDIGDWIDSKGKKHKGDSDNPRYKALGNSLALPFWFWLMRRIAAQYARPATLGSLFDGIGGFPYVWQKCNGEGTALWASEVEEFAIAVTKKHFPEDKQE